MMAEPFIDASRRPLGEPLREIRNVRQISGEPIRRWFTSADMDLIVWFGEGGGPVAFELCYDKGHGEHSIAWNARRGYTHAVVDDGERRPGKPKASPLLLADGPFDARRLHGTIHALRHGLPAEVAELVLRALAGHPNF
jgi:hypothetical protein